MAFARTRSIVLALTVLGLLGTPIAFGQITTGEINGSVVVQGDGTSISGVALTAVHEPTGTTYRSVTNDAGRFRIPNCRVGGPYTLTAEAGGFRTSRVTEVTVSLGESVKVAMEMPLESIEEELTVVSESNPLIAPNRTGAASTVPQEALDNLPSINREILDVARTNPFFTVSAENEDPDSLSVAGRSARYNNIQIDGAVNNDLYGLADQGTPGGQAETAPISFDAIQEVQLILADFDVRNGGFTGGLVNAVTRQGTNSWKGSVYYFTRDESFVGDGPPELGEPGAFSQDEYGFRLGGPISRDKLFFFVNYEQVRKETPTGWSLDGTGGGQVFADGQLVDEANRFRTHLIDAYGFDPGPLSQEIRPTDNDKFFGRLDWNASSNTNVTFRYNWIDAENVINRPNQTTYEWESEGYNFTNETSSALVQANSVFGPDKFNEFRLAYSSIEDRRAGDVPFPWMEVEDVRPALDTRYEFEAGTEAFSTFNSLDQDVLEITDNFTWILDEHTLTLGTHNELFTFDNLFVQNGFGAYEFRTGEDFLAGEAWRYRHTFPNEGQDPVASFDVNQLGFYAGDQWYLRPNLTLTYGLRLDVPFFPDTPGYNPEIEEIYGYRTDEIPDGEQMWSPRFGFNWDVAENGTQQLRGGVGLFAGRTPYVWIANQFSRTGLVFTDLQATEFDVGGPIPFNPDPFDQPRDIGGASTQEVNLIDPGFQYPQVWRVNLAYDYVLPWQGLVATAEAVLAQSRQEIKYENINLQKTGEVVPFDGRPIYERVSTDFSGAYLITNTSKGEQSNLNLKIEKPFRDGWWGYLSYTWGESKAINDGTSSRAVSNWQFTEAVDPNNPDLSTSDFEVEHRFNAGLSYLFRYAGDWSTNVAFFYNHQSGRPYSNVYGFQVPAGSINGDGAFSNDLIYVPEGPDDVIITNGTWEDLDAYINADSGLSSARGGIVGRNASKSPWSHSLDLRLTQDVPIRDTRFQITLDILNLVNLFDDESGAVRYANFNAVAPVDFIGTDEATGKPIYALDGIVFDPDERWETHSLLSRWRARLGLRFTF